MTAMAAAVSANVMCRRHMVSVSAVMATLTRINNIKHSRRLNSVDQRVFLTMAYEPVTVAACVWHVMMATNASSVMTKPIQRRGMAMTANSVVWRINQ